MGTILNGYLLSNMVGGTIFFAFTVQQLDSVRFKSDSMNSSSIFNYVLKNISIKNHNLSPQTDHIDFGFVNIVFTAIISLAVTYPFCFHSTNAFESMISINQNVYNIVWYKLPVKYQHYIKLMLIPSEHIRELSGYGLINCSLETFRKVF